jgi:hypothetical protein
MFGFYQNKEEIGVLSLSRAKLMLMHITQRFTRRQLRLAKDFNIARKNSRNIPAILLR